MRQHWIDEEEAEMEQHRDDEARYLSGEYDPRYPGEQGFWVRLVVALIALSALAVGLGAFAAAAGAQVAPAVSGELCMARAQGVKNLKEKHGEQQAATGITSTGDRVIEFWVSEKGSWTAFYTNVHGIACVIASGEGWTMILPANGPKKESF